MRLSSQFSNPIDTSCYERYLFAAAIRGWQRDLWCLDAPFLADYRISPVRGVGLLEQPQRKR
jgi:hypothetical protein